MASPEPVQVFTVLCTGDFQLVDLSDRLPELKRVRGLTKWRVAMDKTNEKLFNTWEDYTAHLGEDISAGTLQRSMFPPKDADDMHLDRWYFRFFDIQCNRSLIFTCFSYQLENLPSPPEHRRFLCCST